MGSGAEFQRFERDFFERCAQLDPVRAAEMGLAEFAPRVPSAAPEVAEARVEAFERLAAALQALPPESLDAEQALDVELAAGEAAVRRHLQDHGRYLAAGGDPALEVAEMLDPLFSRETFPPRVRAEGLLARLRGVTHFLHEARARYTRPVRYWTRAAIESVGHTQAFLEELVTGVPAILGGEPGNLAQDPVCEEIARAATSAQADLDEFRKWLEHEVLPNPDHGVAMGRDEFAELVRRRRLGWDLEGLRDLGEEQLARLGEVYAAEMAERFPGQDLAAAEEAWRAEVPATFPEVLELFREAVAASRRFVLEELGLPLPGPERLEVRATPEFLQSSIPSAAYFDPPRYAEGEQVGVYMVTPDHGAEPPLEHTPGMIFNVSGHEGYPGHHLQLSWANRQPSLVRAWLSGDEFCEGWAHYCEEMMTAEGFAPVPGMRASQLLDARFRALRILVDLGLQTGELDPEAAARRLVEDGGVGPARAAGEVSWYSYSPGYPLGYLVGKLLVWRLREACERRDGATFELPAFHAAVLAGGTMPVWGHARRLGVEVL